MSLSGGQKYIQLTDVFLLVHFVNIKKLAVFACKCRYFK